MCRFLYAKTSEEIEPLPVMSSFAECCRSSVEFQGHGWGICWQESGSLRQYNSIQPIWEADFTSLPPTKAYLAHARSAFQNRDIVLENTMPFVAGSFAFAFNGELNGVRLNAPGRTGAAKIFELIQKFNQGDTTAAFERAIKVIRQRTTKIRALNMVLTDLNSVLLCSEFNERPDYFTIHHRRSDNELMLCSEKLPDYNGWQPIPNRTVEVIQ